MKSRLVILSDLWGYTNNEWMTAYTYALQDEYSISYYDCRELAGIDLELKEESVIHSAFVNGGIERAVENLCSLEKGDFTVLAFSIGGTIAWKAALAGLNVKTIYALSSTRLRYEAEKPPCKIMLAYGENDENKPNQSWFDQHEITPLILEGMDHEMYMSGDVTKLFYKQIIQLSE